MAQSCKQKGLSFLFVPCLSYKCTPQKSIYFPTHQNGSLKMHSQQPHTAHTQQKEEEKERKMLIGKCLIYNKLTTFIKLKTIKT